MRPKALAPAVKRAVILVLDSVGVGELPDARLYGDEGSNTLGHIDAAVSGLALPNLGRLGLGNVLPLTGTPPSSTPLGTYGRMGERSPGKDSITGHWEIAGVILDRPFPTYPHGFPPEVIDRIEEAIGRPVIGNVAASGTEIIADLGGEHLSSGNPIVYTSADSVLQIAAHVEVVPTVRLYAWCEAVREIMAGSQEVARVIARPFAGSTGAFARTLGRRDFSLPPPSTTILDAAMLAGLPTTAIGKVSDLFAGRGISRSLPEKANASCLEALIEVLRAGEATGVVLATLVDFDTLFGHRNDAAGYARALISFDQALPRLLEALRVGDALFITADHGNDPTTASFDHSREYVPLLVFGEQLAAGRDLGTRETFADVAATVRDLLGLGHPRRGASFAGELLD
ncbi:MAG: phosphopentomutase [Actinomycetota bacterium]